VDAAEVRWNYALVAISQTVWGCGRWQRLDVL
jgi:hypothetical protein